MTKPAPPGARTSRRPRSSPRTHGTPPHRRHWWRWILGGAVVLVVLAAGAVAAFIALQPTSAPLALPAGAASAPAGPLAGTWRVSAGSAAGFRVRENTLGFSNDTVGRTTAVSGAAVLTGNQIASGSFRINLTTVKVGGKTQPQFATSLDTRRYPAATVTLARPVPLSAAFAAGRTVTITAPGELTLRGITRAVTVTITARRDGTVLQAVGTIPVTFATWGITRRPGYGAIGSLADHGTAEFLLVLRRAG